MSAAGRFNALACFRAQRIEAAGDPAYWKAQGWYSRRADSQHRTSKWPEGRLSDIRIERISIVHPRSAPLVFAKLALRNSNPRDHQCPHERRLITPASVIIKRRT
jgi:hypothetical protein